MEGSFLAFHSSTIWVEQYALYFHEASSGYTEEARGMNGPLPGRCTGDGKLQEHSKGTRAMAMDLLFSLGFLINMNKSVISPL